MSATPDEDENESSPGPSRSTWDAPPSRTSEPRATLHQLTRHWADHDVELTVSYRTGAATADLSLIRIPEHLRGQGTATAAMNDLVRWADIEGITIGLTPDDSFGASKTQLERWYRRFGFVPNRGTAKDYRTSSTMIRPAPAERTEARPDPPSNPADQLAALLAELDVAVANGTMTPEEAAGIRDAVT